MKYPKKFELDLKNYKNNSNLDMDNILFGKDKTIPLQEMVIMVGSPGSGKSTITKNYLIHKNYVHVNNDTLKSALKCQKVAEEALQSGKSVVIDNTNPSQATRKLYISIAQKNKVPVRCFYFKYPKPLTFHLNNLRNINFSRQHKSSSVPDVVIHTWYKNIEEPTIAEGFKEVIEVPFIPGPFENKIDEEIFYLFS